MTGQFDRRRYNQAAARQRLAREQGRSFPVPARISAALELRGLDGPQVDEACGVVEPAVDQWESGELIPTTAQVAALAPFVCVSSKGGPYDDQSFVAGFHTGQMWMTLQAAKDTSVTTIDLTVRAPLVDQLELIGMYFGFPVMQVQPGLPGMDEWAMVRLSTAATNPE